MENDIQLQILARLDAMGTRFDRMDAKVDTIITRLDAMDTRFDAMDTRFDAMDTRLDAMDTRFDGLESQISDLRITQARSEINLTSEISAMKDSQQIVIDIGKEGLELLHELRQARDDMVSARVAVDAKLIDHEGRIISIERKVAV